MAAQRVQAALRQLQLYMATLAGIKAAPEYPPEQLDPFPIAVAYVQDGVVLPGEPAGAKTGLYTLMVEVHVARAGDLPKAAEALAGFADSVPDLLIDKLWNDNKWAGTINTFEQIRVTFGPSKWAGIDTLSYKFAVEATKLQAPVP